MMLKAFLLFDLNKEAQVHLHSFTTTLTHSHVLVSKVYHSLKYPLPQGVQFKHKSNVILSFDNGANNSGNPNDGS